MTRLFCPSQNISAGTVSISDKGQVHYLKNVLRAKVGEEVAFFDEKGNEYVSQIQEASSRQIVLKIRKKRKAALPKRIQLTVACAIPKKAKMDDIVDKLTQLGAERIIPMMTERVIVKLDPRKESSRLLRWDRIAKNALQQCQGALMPKIEPIKTLEEVLLSAQAYDLKLIPTLEPGSKPLKEACGGRLAKNILALIGPEGDFSAQEVILAKKSGFIPVTLGERVLRVDTAAAAVAAFIKLNENR